MQKQNSLLRLCDCGEEFDVIVESPRYAIMRCENQGCENFGRAVISRNYRYLDLIEKLIVYS